MKKPMLWSEKSPDCPTEMNGMTIEAGGLDTARGLLIGLAISQIFWLALAFFLFR
jgi:hypothetical protein